MLFHQASLDPETARVSLSSLSVCFTDCDGEHCLKLLRFDIFNATAHD